MIGFLAGNAWWILGLLVMAAAIFAPAALWRARWPLGVLLSSVLALVFFLQANALRQQISQRAVADTRAALDASEAARTATQATATDLAASDAAYQKGRTDAQTEFNLLGTALAAGTERVRDNLRCPQARGLPDTTAAAGRSDGEAPAGFTDADARIAFAIARDGDDAIRQLSLAQDTIAAYVRQCGALTP